ncbi:MAG: aspartate/glutamate racemase family protein [Anaerolineae bacterium]
MKKLALLHTVVWLTKVIGDLCAEVMPEVKVYHMVDESLLQEAIAKGGPTPRVYRAVADYVLHAEEAGADAVLVTCSSIGPCVETARRLVSIPVLRIDEAMADAAVAQGKRVGVIATLPSTLKPTSDLVAERARDMGKEVEVEAVLCQGAFEAASAGDRETHDRIVMEGLRQLASRVDVIVLAQASMASVVDRMAEGEVKVPVLSSPRLGVQRAKEVLQGRRKT